MPAFTGTTRYWHGTGNWNSTTSWRTQAGATGVPVSGDKCIFGSYSKHSVTTGPSSAIDLYSLEVEPSYGGDLGGYNNWLSNLVADEIIYKGTGSFWYRAAGSTGWVTNRMIINTPDRLNGVFLDSNIDNTNYIEKLYCSRGKVTMAATSGGVDYLHVGHDLYPREAIVDIQGGYLKTIGRVIMTNGILTCNRWITEYGIQHGGRWTQDGTMDLVFVNEGTFYWNYFGTLTEAYISGGAIDLNGSSGAKTVSTVYKSGGEVRYNPNQHSVTFVNLLGLEERK
jgi:hypothetical protein